MIFCSIYSADAEFMISTKLETVKLTLFLLSSPLRALLSQYTKNATKGVGRTKWMNSPNVYQKVEVLETGTTDPKTITKVEVIVAENKRKLRGGN